MKASASMMKEKEQRHILLIMPALVSTPQRIDRLPLAAVKLFHDKPVAILRRWTGQAN